MGITEQWNMLAAALRQHVCFKSNGLPLPDSVLDPICAPSGALVAIHRWGEPLPAYLDPGARALLGMSLDTMDPATLLKWYVGQRDLVQGRFQEYTAHFNGPSPMPVSICAQLTDSQGHTQWYCGTCGVLCDPGGRPIILAMFFPVGMLHAGVVNAPPDAEHLRLFATLTARERDVLQLLGAQWRPEEVASRLNISPDTVASHKKSLLRKLCARTIIGLAPFAAMMPQGPPPPIAKTPPPPPKGSRFGTDNGFH